MGCPVRAVGTFSLMGAGVCASCRLFLGGEARPHAGRCARVSSCAIPGSRVGLRRVWCVSTIAPFCGLKITFSCGCARTWRAECFPWSPDVHKDGEGGYRAVGRGRRCGRSQMGKNWAAGVYHACVTSMGWRLPCGCARIPRVKRRRRGIFLVIAAHLACGGVVA